MKKLIDSIKLSGDTIKIIACILMLIDHTSFCLLHYYMSVYHMDILPEDYSTYNNIYTIGRGLGRIAFPIFCFFLVEGFSKTRNVTKYASRLLALAIISEIPFDLAHYHEAFHLEHQNTIFTLFTGLVMISLLDYIMKNLVVESNNFKILICLCVVAGFCELSQFMNVDYSYKGMLLIAVLYATRSIPSLQLVSGAAVTAWEDNGPVAFLLLYFYNPDAKPKLKYFFYIFYPLHLMLIYLVAILMFP